MGPATRRTFTLRDTMTLVASAAFGAWFLSRSHELEFHYFGTLLARPNKRIADHLLEGLTTLRVFTASLAGLPIALVVLGLADPGPVGGGCSASPVSWPASPG